MVKIKATKTANYAQRDPSKPCVYLVEGITYDLDSDLANRVVELDGGEIVESDIESSDVQVETSIVDIESKDTTKVDAENIEPNSEQKPTKKSSRKPGQKKVEVNYE